MSDRSFPRSVADIQSELLNGLVCFDGDADFLPLLAVPRREWNERAFWKSRLTVGGEKQITIVISVEVRVSCSLQLEAQTVGARG